MFLILLFRSFIVDGTNENNIFVTRLQKSKWFQKSYVAGMMLCLINGILFFSTMGILYGLMMMYIPYVHLIVMALAVFSSLWLWTTFNKAWKGSNKERIVIASVGSSFYFGLTVLFVYMYVRIEPYYPGEDTFMRALGLTFASIVTAVACITCFLITGFTKQPKNLRHCGKYNSTTEAKNSQ